MSSESSVRTSTIVIASVSVLLTGALAYAVYFDHKRQTDAGFRRNLKRQSRRAARADKEAAEAQGEKQIQAIRAAMEDIQEEGFPSGVEEREAFFMNQVGQGEVLCQDESTRVEAAACFYKALKVYPNPKDLINIYDKTVPKPVIDILAEMIAMDPSINITGFGGGSANSSSAGIDD